MPTDYTQREPRGFGIEPWGDPTDPESVKEDKEFRIQGWGDPLTQFTRYTDD